MKTENKSSLSLLSIAGVEPYQEKSSEAYMNKNQLNHFKKILQAWCAQLHEESENIMCNMTNESINFPDPVDRATQEEEFNLKLRTKDRERKLIKKIERTLRKIDDATFGYCDSCGVEIGIRRLEAQPTANLCIDCKTLAEFREKQIISR
ncbi:MAG: RNA polymerase-binding protein DksA [Candidatus Dasytiphilus stammeri]